MTPAQLEVAEKHQAAWQQQLGYSKQNMTFVQVCGWHSSALHSCCILLALITSKATSAVCRITSQQCLHWDPRPWLQQCYDSCPAVGALLISAAVPVPAFLTSLFDSFRCFRGFATPGSWFAGVEWKGPQIAT